MSAALCVFVGRAQANCLFAWLAACNVSACGVIRAMGSCRRAPTRWNSPAYSLLVSPWHCTACVRFLPFSTHDAFIAVWFDCSRPGLFYRNVRITQGVELCQPCLMVCSCAPTCPGLRNNVFTCQYDRRWCRHRCRQLQHLCLGDRPTSLW